MLFRFKQFPLVLFQEKLKTKHLKPQNGLSNISLKDILYVRLVDTIFEVYTRVCTMEICISVVYTPVSNITFENLNRVLFCTSIDPNIGFQVNEIIIAKSCLGASLLTILKIWPSTDSTETAVFISGINQLFQGGYRSSHNSLPLISDQGQIYKGLFCDKPM